MPANPELGGAAGVRLGERLGVGTEGANDI